MQSGSVRLVKFFLPLGVLLRFRGQSEGVAVLRHHGEREIVPVATAVAGLEVISVHSHNPAIRKVAEGAADWVRARVADHSQG